MTFVNVRNYCYSCPYVRIDYHPSCSRFGESPERFSTYVHDRCIDAEPDLGMILTNLDYWMED